MGVPWWLLVEFLVDFLDPIWQTFRAFNGFSSEILDHNTAVFTHTSGIWVVFTIGFATSNYDQIQNWIPGTWQVFVTFSGISDPFNGCWWPSTERIKRPRLVDPQLMTCLIKGSVGDPWDADVKNQKFSINFPKKKTDLGYTALAVSRPCHCTQNQDAICNFSFVMIQCYHAFGDGYSSYEDSPMIGSGCGWHSTSCRSLAWFWVS